MTTTELRPEQRTLTPRQERIAEGIAKGLSYAEIGRELTSRRHPHGITAGVVRIYARQLAQQIENPAGVGPKTAIKLWWIMRQRREQQRG